MLSKKIKRALFVGFAACMVSCTTSNAATIDKNADQLGSALNQDAQKALEEVLVAYHKSKILLADDKTEGLSESAESLKNAAQSAITKVPSLKSQLEPIVSAADALKSSSNIENARKDFGEVSRYIIALAIAEPSLQKGRYVFECPMAAGYKKWVQPNEQISNPYMGKKMLTCGSASDWK